MRTKAKYLIPVFCLCHFITVAQEHPARSFFRLSRPEKAWVVFHPFIAKKSFILTQFALAETNVLKRDTVLDGDWNGGQVDAFRHSYWMALLAQKIKLKKAERLGIAHEKGNRIDFKKGRLEEDQMPDSVSTLMDLANNKTGLAIGCNFKQQDMGQLKQFIIGEIKKGKLTIILKDQNGNAMDCTGKPLEYNVWKGKWNIPKCLVPSNRISKRK